MTLSGKTFVVTGGASGIGLTIVQQLLKLSATVHVIDMASALPEFDSSLGGGKVHTYGSVDVSSRQAVRQTFGTIFSQGPRLDGLVNCAGIVRQHASTPDSDDLFRKVWEVNLGGTWNVATEFARSFQDQAGAGAEKDGAKERKKSKDATVSIVNVGSMASVRGLPGIPGYVASKHAVLGLTRAWAQEWGPLGVRVNLIAPGIVKTPLTVQSPAENPVVFPCALKDYAEPEEIAGVAAFLLGGGSSYVTGQVIEVNGGWA
ncbi:putative secondary metabolism biosynthetic enzyme [Diaporthe australafricana]|uniref:Secondary metabolism biosynthetic enzyme n=1 Tax=Diaporthe australafricana TaxID=127596 RepID=A0ABR3W4B3_9PEZI